MARTKISEFSATPANNTDIDNINIAEGCAPSGINDAIRELMAQLKDFQTGAVGDSFNGPVGTTTAAAGAFTTLSASSTVSGTGFSTYLASPPAIGGTAAAAGSFTTLSASGAVTLSGGTANGVAYLNGSKVVTSGSALTFDGTNFGTTGNANLGSGSKSTDTQINLLADTGTQRIYIERGSRSLVFYDVGAAIENYRIAGITGIQTWGVGGSEQMRLTSTGLGIGTSSPSFRLDVQAPTGVIKLTATTGTNASYFRADNSGGILYFGLDDSTASTFGTAGAYGTVIQRPASTAFNINRAGTVDFYISTTGNVGIGTSSPAEKLTVVGNIRLNGNSLLIFQQNSGLAAGTMSFRNSAGTQKAAVASYYNVADEGALEFVGPTGSTNMILNSSGNLGLGVTPSAWRSEFKALQLNSQTALFGSADSTFLQTNAYINSAGTNLYIGTGNATRYRQDAGAHQWHTAPSGTAGNAITFSQAMTLDVNGTYYLGTTSPISVSKMNIYCSNLAATVQGIGIKNGANQNFGAYLSFVNYQDNLAGSITQSGTTTVAYNTSSDYRLKNITGPITTSGAYIDSLNPVEGTWKADGSTFVGLIAHEVQEASRTPIATGVKDGEKMQAMDYSSAELIANLIAEVKSLRKRLADAGIA